MPRGRPRKVIIAPQASPENKAVEITPVQDDFEESQHAKDVNTPAHRRALARAELRSKFVTTADQVAQETMHFRNYKWDTQNKHYPETIDAHMRFVTKYYPYSALGKALYVDEPKTDREILACYEKQKIMHKMGLKHIVVEPMRTNPDTGKPLPASTVSECLEQLGAL